MKIAVFWAFFEDFGQSAEILDQDEVSYPHPKSQKFRDRQKWSGMNPNKYTKWSKQVLHGFKPPDKKILGGEGVLIAHFGVFLYAG